LCGPERGIDLSAFVGQKIRSIELDKERNGGDGGVVLTFEGGRAFMLYDCARSCCESRYITTDDDLGSFAGATLADIDVAEGPTTEVDGEPHETAFLKVKTSLGDVTFETHNEHNGYYGGMIVTAQMIEEPA
ncbi:MAG: DUF7448 domain-containing protein, partial [Nannocystaceae bacterium]